MKKSMMKRMQMQMKKVVVVVVDILDCDEDWSSWVKFVWLESLESHEERGKWWDHNRCQPSEKGRVS